MKTLYMARNAARDAAASSWTGGPGSERLAGVGFEQASVATNKTIPDSQMLFMAQLRM
jgi:hypothetical protein